MPVITKTRILTDTTLDNLADVVFGGLYVPEDANRDRPFIPFLDRPSIADVLHKWGRQPVPAGAPTTLPVEVLDEKGMPLRHKDEHGVERPVTRPGDVKGVTYSLVSRRRSKNYLRVGVNHYFDVCAPENPNITWSVDAEDTIVIDCFAPWTNRVEAKLTCNQEWARPCFELIDHELERRWPTTTATESRLPKKGGRPAGTGKLSGLAPLKLYETYWTLFAQNREALRRREEPSQAELGTELYPGKPVSAVTVRRYLKVHGLSWPPHHDYTQWVKNSP